MLVRSYLKNVYWPNPPEADQSHFVGASFQILEIQQYSSGLKRCSAANLNQNPIFEMASIFKSSCSRILASILYVAIYTFHLATRTANLAPRNPQPAPRCYPTFMTIAAAVSPAAQPPNRK